MATAGRTALSAPIIELDTADEVALRRAADTLPVLAQQTSAAMAVIGYALPYDRERVVQETRFFMATSAEAMLEAGKRLLVIKEHELHGEFTAILEDRLNLNDRTARVMMQAAIKFLTNPVLEPKRQALAVLGKTKLFELMAEHDDDLSVLADGGTLAGHTLDEFDRMTSREMKAALRESRKDAVAKAEVMVDKNALIDTLRAEQKRIEKRIAKATPDQVLADLQKEATALMNDALGCIRGNLRQALIKLQDHDGNNIIFMAGLIGQLQADLQAQRDEFNLPDVANAADAALAAESAQWAPSAPSA